MEKQIVKAGWLQRRSSVVHRWKRCWFVLYRDGNLTRFESPDSRHPEKSLILRAVCVGLRTGAECQFEAPDGAGSGQLLHLQMRDHNDDLKLCAENMDDMKAWQLTIEEARSTAGAQVPAGSQVFYPQVVSHVYGGYPGQIITQQGQTSVTAIPNAAGGNTVVMANQPGYVICEEPRYHYGRGHYGRGNMWGPVFWW
ncbi:pleckstrin homology domain-containing family B member 2-like [Mya arenaria]|uniref:pleckstrin homology domain-containing family B member 2-like n=1 Tax=Mya arenaria TaxID=6604 RepID=UPI0022E6210E|nr:pleckstrin homology domain-containing family B member 2-like [Mya arenaria]XP_052794427.1 pleckstrin homology domain-containing family B member 2-like [Mya arenaria]XP_052794428.1 pleckstrin homology domain-containing family B member 2-like [Mya arenaria]